ncbi:Fluoroquinolones export permease protein [Bacillus sp. THAF10]|uniref:hypothetical protein n=1 Tax=Bacillus sp. THAF10 TaxID=2587848 RepID=UPI00126883E5|nr:hypothetical protein [Bacillus sp. THAF10]QFT89703.1 Fluoroquinolones export permease protein [Bacillus sp. THAF10]
MKMMYQRMLNDARLISRDGILMVGIFAPLLIAVLVRVLYPYANQLLQQFSGLVLSSYVELIMGIIFLMIPAMLGMMTGFMLLDDRDEGLLDYYAITPLQKSGYIRYRLGASFTLSFFLFFAVHVITDKVEISLFQSLIIATIFALEAPIFALLLGMLAANKVEGLALFKVMNVSIITPIIAMLVPGLWKILFMLIPTYWPVAALTTVSTNQFIPICIAGLGIHLVLLVFLVKKF